MNKQEKKNYHKIACIAEIAASQIVADRKGNAFIVEKIVKNCYPFCYYHCYLCILALLRIEIIDSFSLRSMRFQSSYCAKVRVGAKKRLKGEGEGRRGNACPQTPRFWKTPLDISRFGSFVN